MFVRNVRYKCVSGSSCSSPVEAWKRMTGWMDVWLDEQVSGCLMDG